MSAKRIQLHHEHRLAYTADGQRSAEELLSEADLALYRAKDQGRDRVAVFDEELRTTAVQRLVTERMVRRALDERRMWSSTSRSST